jgi:hypothetical protein
MLGDLKTAGWIHVKGWLFLVMGVIAAALILVEAPTLKVALLLTIAVWAFCRFYYYAFYVIEKYVDSSFKFAGLGSFLKWWLTRGKE